MGLDMYAVTIDAKLVQDDWVTDFPVEKTARRAVGFLDLSDSELEKLDEEGLKQYWLKRDEATKRAQSEGWFNPDLEYWRKHHDLHGWMQRLYESKGGTDPQFNCNNVRLTTEDLDQLEADIKSRNLPGTRGFFFGDNPPDEESDAYDLAFIKKAREAINSGKAVFYDSWW